MTRIFNKANEKTKRRVLRRNMPRSEALLWARLKNRGLNGCKFRRQYGVDTFVVDFYCSEARLAIEIDGGSHFVVGAEFRDGERQRVIESYGISFLRFTNDEIGDNIEGVLQKISERLDSNSTG